MDPQKLRQIITIIARRIFIVCETLLLMGIIDDTKSPLTVPKMSQTPSEQTVDVVPVISENFDNQFQDSTGE